MQNRFVCFLIFFVGKFVGEKQSEVKEKPRRKGGEADEKERDEKFEAFLALAMPKKAEKKKGVMPWENPEEEEGEKAREREREVFAGVFS